MRRSARIYCIDTRLGVWLEGRPAGCYGAVQSSPRPCESLTAMATTDHDDDARWSYHFVGRVTPERASVTLDGLGAITLTIPQEGWTGTVTVSVICSQLSLIFTGDVEISDMATLKNIAQEFAQSLVDTLGYAWGRGYVVEITAVSTSHGQHTVFGVGFPVLENAQAERPLPVEQVLLLTIGNQWLRRALGELRGAIREPSDTGFHCQKGVEAVRHHFQGDSDPGAGWTAMRDALNLSMDTLKILNEFGDRQRHADMPPMSDAERARDMTLAWKVVDRFVLLLHREVGNLPVDEFPML
jgi:hypothetical protein